MVLVLICSMAYAGGDYYKKTVFDAQAIADTTAVLSDPIDMSAYKPEGYYTVYVYVDDAAGNIDLEWLVSMDGVTYLEPLDRNGVRIANICTDFAFNEGPGSDGKEIFTVPTPTMGKFVKIRATASQALDGLTVELNIK